jgi:hypothetical protein
VIISITSEANFSVHCSERENQRVILKLYSHVVMHVLGSVFNELSSEYKRLLQTLVGTV